VVVLGLVSLCMDASSELIHSLLPVFVVAGLGASPMLLGLIEGAAEVTASLMRILSGAFSDRIRRRRPLLLAGYGLSALSKPLFPLAQAAAAVLAARIVDRLGKGIRGAPRDALLADVTPAQLRGAAYGLRQSLDSVGAILGPLGAVALMHLLANDVRAVLWAAVLPALLAILLILRWVPESAPAPAPVAAQDPPRWRADALRQFPGAFWRVVACALLLSLARFSDAFLLLRAWELGLAAEAVPLLMVVMNVAYALCAWPVGIVSDRLGRAALLGPGIGLLLAADLLLVGAEGPWRVSAAALVWGLHMGATQGSLAALVADAAPPALRGTAFGVLHCVMGVGLFLASVLAGWLWQHHGAAGAFTFSAAVAVAALLALPGWRSVKNTQ